MKVHAIDAEGKAWHKDLPGYTVDRDSWREPIQKRTFYKLSYAPVDMTHTAYDVREWRRYGRTYDGLPIMVDTAGPWEVKEVCATDICANHPAARERSESLVRTKARHLCDDAGEWHLIDERMTTETFSLSQCLTGVKYRMLVQVRKR